MRFYTIFKSLRSSFSYGLYWQEKNLKVLMLQKNLKKLFLNQLIKILKKKRKIIREIMIVTGRADISVVLQGSMDEINNMVIDFKKIKEIVTTETLIEVEVNLGW